MSQIDRTSAIVLRRWDFSETSFVVALLTASFGKMRALAKGAKRPRSPMQGGLEPVTLGDVVVYRKAPPAMHILSQAQTSEYWREIRRDLPRFYAAHYFAELLLGLVPEEVPDPDLFEHAAGAFRRLDAGGRVEAVTVSFEAGLLRRSGSFPRTDGCVDCGSPWKERDRVAFHAPSGGALCPACASRKQGDTVAVASGTLRLLDQFACDRVPHPDRVCLAPKAVREMRAVLDACVRLLLEAEPRSRKFLPS
jgi:DNA repair protein RecO (recombination protein O)